MSFQPIVPMSGYAGWVFLNRTMEAQQEAHQKGLQSDTDYFAENIGEVRTAEELVADRRLLSVALGAFGLDADIDNKFFIQKVLSEGTSDSNSLANKLADDAYSDFSKAFGFGEGIPPRTTLTGFADEIIGAYQQFQFEVDVGAQNEDFRLALYAQRELADIAESGASVDTKWYSVMGSTALRTVFETTFGLPSSFASIDLEDQLETFKDKAQRQFGSEDLEMFSDPESLDKFVQTFLLRSELANGAQSLTSANTALILLGGQ